MQDQYSMELISVETHVFKHPFSMIVSGVSGSGKTTFVKNLILNSNTLISPKPSKVIISFSEN